MRVIERSEGWIFSKLGDELVMMNVDRGAYVGLNTVAARIWDLIETPRSVADLCAMLSEEFEVDDALCRAEVESFISKLEARGIATAARA